LLYGRIVQTKFWQGKNKVRAAGRSILDKTTSSPMCYQDQIQSLYEAHPAINFENLFSKGASQMRRLK
jgi:hypothetical protein